ncbi:MAG TPA: stimulus-sensing domain-containing protein [Alphaproteobacteria bacterium]|nr:stimulus-sensing domain-containing protein [Alphaproteobacteria bacterium]
MDTGLPSRLRRESDGALRAGATRTIDRQKGRQRAVARAARDLLRPHRPWFSKLTARVLAVNVLALMILVAGLLYLGQYEERLIQSELEAMRTEALIFSGGLAEGAVVGSASDRQALDPELSRQMVRRLFETTDTRTRLFSDDGALIADSRMLGGPGGLVEIEPLQPPVERSRLRDGFDTLYAWVTNQLPERKRWPIYQEDTSQEASDYAPAMRALAGNVGQKVWSRPGGGQILAVAVPVQRLRAVLGAVMITRDTTRIDRSIQSLREDILKIFGVAVCVTVLMSLYLSGTITRPIRRLAFAADQVRRSHGRQQVIPDFTRRRDEIGDLSAALREMTAALWARMDAIERFAADVSHELKNPLSSLRSAVETVSRVTDPEQRRRLMAIIVEDVQRLDRLITDISDASRLDSELSRAEAESVDIGRMLEMLADLYRTTADEGGPRFTLTVEGNRKLMVPGLEDRLVQVFRNLITNAISFAPPGSTIAVAARRRGAMVEVTIDDEGPGIPPSKLEAIFDRFYTERPASEKFGTHSGLGLAISKQIVEAHRGRIFAENRKDGSGARFTVQIPAE